MRWNLDARAREVHSLGEPSLAALERVANHPVSRELALHFYPNRTSVSWTCIVTDRQGHRRWDRTVGVGDLPVPIEELRGRGTAEALEILLRSALDNLA